MFEILAIIALGFFVFTLSSKINRLEKRINDLGHGAPVAKPAPVMQATATDSHPVHAAAHEPASAAWSGYAKQSPATSTTRLGPTAGEQLAQWLKEDWLLKLGALLILLGFAWLATYAFTNNWIGPMGRIALGVVAGALLMVFGWLRMQKYVKQGGIFLVLGSSVVIVTIFAARVAYDFFTPISALAIMFLCAAFVALASVRHKMQPMAFLSLIIASITPFLVHWPMIDYVSLFVYLFIVILGTIWIVALTGWRSLLVAGLVAFLAYSLPHLGSSWLGADNGTLLGISYAFAALFFVTGTLGILKTTGEERRADMWVAGGNGMLLLAWIITAAPEQWQSLIISGWMVAFLIAAFFVFKLTRQVAPFLIYCGVGVAMLAAATAVELSGAALTIAYTVEVVAAAFVLYPLLRNLKFMERAGLLLIVPIFLSIESITSMMWRSGIVFHKHFFVLFILACSLLAIGGFIWKRKEESVAKLTLYPLLMSAGVIYLYILLWLVVHAMFRSGDAGTMISLVIYTIVGLASYFRGKLHGMRGLVLHGGVLLGFVVGRLLIVDVWAMSLGGRIVTFFMVGALLMATAFFGRKKKIETPTQ